MTGHVIMSITVVKKDNVINVWRTKYEFGR